MLETEPSDLLEAKRREQVPQALARLVVVGLFIVLWGNMWLVGMPMPVPFLLVLVAETIFFLVYWRAVVPYLRTVAAIDRAHHVMLAAEIAFHTAIVYFLGTISWLGPFAYMFGMVFANTFLDLRRGFFYTAGAIGAFTTLILLEATGVVPHYEYLPQGPLRYRDPQFVATTIVGGVGVFTSMYLWVNWVGSELRRQRDAAVKTQERLFVARAELQRTNEELEQRVLARTSDLEAVNAALHESQERLRTVISNAPIVLFAVDCEGTFTLSEGKGLDALGLRPGEMVGQSVFEVYRDVPAIEANIRRALAGETFLATVEVGELWFETHYAPLRGEDGRVTGVIGVASNVTERVRVERELREREANNRALLEAIPDMMLRIRRDGTIIDFKPSHEAAPQTNVPEIIGRSVYEFLPGETGEGARAQIERALETGQPQLYEFPLSNEDGETTYRESRMVACAADEVLALVRDVTERKRTEEALRESEAKFRTLAETTAAAVFVFQGTKMKYVNPAAQTQTGYAEHELLAMDFWDVIHPEHRDLVKERGIARQQGRDVPHGYEVKLLTRSGEERWVDFTAGVIEYQGRPAIVGTAFDITERKRIEEALREQAQRDPLTGVLNHAAIVGELRAIADDESTSHAVLMADVDGLKAINDIYGHQMGDEALVLVAKALQRDGAIVGRYGGDEFVAILRGCGAEGAERYHAAVRDRLERARLVDPETGAQVPIVMSLGYAIHPRDARSVHELIQMSDSAMYAAKRQRPTRGRDPVFVKPLGTDRAAELVGQLVPLLTAPGSVSEKLKLVAHRLSVGAGYDAVTFAMFAPEPGEGLLVENTFAQAPDELIDAWHNVQRADAPVEMPETHPVRRLLERTKRPLILDDPWHDERLWAQQREILRAAGLRSALVAPLIWADEVVGMIGVASKRERAFGPADAQFLATVATQVTAIIRTATLLEQLQDTSARLLRAREETVLLLAAAAEAHDQTTGQHLHHLHDLTEALAQELGHNEDEARELGIAAVLHDIGKIRVPESVLARPGKLAEEEWELMKHHTTWGANFLAGHAGLELAATIARSHHERWDGAGYPDGLAGDQIPEAAAIVAVADAFDAITSDRPYRKARSVREAIREIEANAGKQFSPKVVHALKRLHRQRRLKVVRDEREPSAA